MLKIRLTRLGKKKKPYYRIVVANSEARRDGSFLEVVGTYDPTRQPHAVTFQYDKVNAWIAQGAQPTVTVRNLLKKNPAPAVAE